MSIIKKYLKPKNFKSEYDFREAVKYEKLFGRGSIQEYCEGMALIRCFMGEDTGDGYGRGPDEYLYGYLAENGKMIIPFKYRDADNFIDGLARVEDEERNYYLIDRTGNIKNDLDFEELDSFSEGMAYFATRSGQKGFLNTRGEVEISLPDNVYWAKSFCGGRASITFDDRKGFIDISGKFYPLDNE